MKRASFAVVSFFVVFTLALSSKAHGDTSGHINFLYSQKNMEKWEDDLKNLPAYGIEGDVSLGSLPVNLWLGVSSGKESGKSVTRGLTIVVDTTQTEMYVGARTYLQFVPLLTPYVGVGVSTVKADVSGASSGLSSSKSASTTGYLLNAGAILKLGNFHIGADYRVLSGTSLDLASAYSNANYNQMGIVLGFNW